MRVPLAGYCALLLVSGLAGRASAGGEAFAGLPSATQLPHSWDYYEQVEHKGDREHDTSRVCVSHADLVEQLPTDAPGLYWSYVRKNQKARSTEEFELGSIDRVRIVEVVHRFAEPIDYIKILAFNPPETELWCPFYLVAEWNLQLRYARSGIGQDQGQTIIKTEMIDNLAYRSPQPVSVHFRIEQGLPRQLSTATE